MSNYTRPQESRARPAAPFPSEPNRAMQEMMNIIDNLRNIYVQETNALTAADTNTFLKLQDEKLRAAREYQRGVEFIMDNKTDMRSASQNLKERLAAMQADFAALSEKNMEAIRRMQRCTQRLGETVMGAARDEARRQRAFNYADNGAFTSNERKSVSMGINETA